MKMSLKRPTAGTVPRKLELVNICGVQTITKLKGCTP